MNKQLIIFAFASLLWCFGFGLFFYGQNRTTLSADVVLPQVKSEKSVPVRILAFGDMMLDRKVREQINKNGPGYPFDLIKDFLKGDGIANDVVVANAEGPFTYNQSLTMGVKDGPLAFTFNPAILPTLKNLGFTLLDQANNHTLNFGMAGFRQSTTSIAATGLDWFGDPRNKEVKPYVTEIRGEKIAFIGYNEFAYQGLNNVLQAIKDAKKDATFVVVYPHWGEEYKLGFTSAQQKVAHDFVDAGADVVIGTHPHVVEPIEIYGGKIIFYSLGNFIFDQASTGPTSRGLAVKISLTQDSVTYNLFPISIVKQQAMLMTGEERQKELDSLNVQTGTIVVSR
jgi:poly-gamma-glutamate synthesis protein (capsule biosynthesis protein)